VKPPAFSGQKTRECFDAFWQAAVVPAILRVTGWLKFLLTICGHGRQGKRETAVQWVWRRGGHTVES